MGSVYTDFQQDALKKRPRDGFEHKKIGVIDPPKTILGENFDFEMGRKKHYFEMTETTPLPR